jgi:hypothetical protein
MVRLRSAAELNAERGGQGALWEQIRRTALDQVDQFCTRNGLDPGQFMSNMGWLRQGSWREGVDWRGCVEWNRMNEVILSNISPNRKGLDIRGFTRDLQASQEDRGDATGREEVASTPRRRVPRRERQEPAREQEPQQSPPRRERNPAMTAQTWAVAYSQTDEILAKYTTLTDEHRNAIQNIVDLSAPENRRLVERNLRDYVRYLARDARVLDEDQSEKLYGQIMVVVHGAEQSILALRRGPTRSYEIRQERRLEAAGLQRRDDEAPAREFVYRMSVRDRSRTISTFEISSPTEINSSAEFLRMLQNPPQGMAITRIARSGERTTLNNEDIELMRQRFDEMRGQDRYSIRLERQERPGT